MCICILLRNIAFHLSNICKSLTPGVYTQQLIYSNKQLSVTQAYRPLELKVTVQSEILAYRPLEFKVTV